MTTHTTGNYVTSPRRWNPKTTLACMIDRALGWPSAQPKTVYVGQLKEGQDVIDFRRAIVEKMKADISHALRKYGHLSGGYDVTHQRRAPHRR